MTSASKIAIFVCLMLLAVFHVGFGTGVAGFFPALLSSGVFGSRCTAAGRSFPCNAQLEALSKVTSFAFTLMNSISFPVGIMVDFFGGRRCAVVALLMFGFGVILSSLSPPSGVLFSVGFVLFNLVSDATFLSILAYHIPSLDFVSTMPFVIFSGCWDLASFVYPALQEVFRYSGYPLVVILTAYALTVTIPGLLFLNICFPARDDTLPATAEEVSALNISSSFSPGKSAWTLRSLKRQLREAARSIQTPIFWALVFNAVITVSYSYFWLSTVEQYILWRGQGDQLLHFVSVFAWTLPFVGFAFSVVLGAVVQFRSRTMLVMAAFFQAALALSLLWVVRFAAIPTVFIVFVAWRVVSFCTINSCVGFIFGFDMLGRISGAIFTLGGLASLLVDQVVIYWVGVPDPHSRQMELVHIICCSLAAAAAIIFGITARLTLESDSHLFLIDEKVAIVPRRRRSSDAKARYGGC